MPTLAKSLAKFDVEACVALEAESCAEGGTSVHLISGTIQFIISEDDACMTHATDNSGRGRHQLIWVTADIGKSVESETEYTC